MPTTAALSSEVIFTPKMFRKVLNRNRAILVNPNIRPSSSKNDGISTTTIACEADERYPGLSGTTLGPNHDLSNPVRVILQHHECASDVFKRPRVRHQRREARDVVGKNPERRGRLMVRAPNVVERDLLAAHGMKIERYLDFRRDCGNHHAAR